LVKKKVEKPRREFTKRQLSRWQKEKRRQRIIFGSGILILVAVLVIVGVGWYTKEYQPLHQTVITVNDTKFNMNYYINTLEIYGKEQPSEYMYYLAGQVVTIIERNELVRQGAMALGISISNKEVDEELKSREFPLSKEYRDIVRAEMLTNKLQDEYFEQEVPPFAEQRHVMAMFLESTSQAVEVRAKLENDESFTELASELSLDDFSKEESGDLGWRPRSVLALLLNSSIPEEYLFDCEAGELSPPIYDETKTKNVGYWLIKVLEKQEESEGAPEEAHIQAILLVSEEQARIVRARLEVGEDFAALAKELSQLEGAEENGGDLDWLTAELMGPALSEFVFNPELELETLSEPIRDAVETTGGYWLLEVLDIDEYRQIEDEDRVLLKTKLLDDWMSGLWEDPENKVEDYLDYEKQMWAITKVTGG